MFTTLTATRRLLEREGLRPMLLLEDSSMEDFEGINCDQPNSVVVGLAPSRSGYNHLNAAFRSIYIVNFQLFHASLLLGDGVEDEGLVTHVYSLTCYSFRLVLLREMQFRNNIDSSMSPVHVYHVSLNSKLCTTTCTLDY